MRYQLDLKGGGRDLRIVLVNYVPYKTFNLNNFAWQCLLT